MAKLSRFNGLEGWDKLDTYFGREIKGLHFKYTSFTRTFCRCGHADNKFILKCPVCNNYVFEELERDDKNNSYFSPLKKISTDNNSLQVSKHHLYYNENSKGTVIISLLVQDKFILSRHNVFLTESYHKNYLSFIEDNNLEPIIMANKDSLGYEDLIEKYKFFIYDEYPYLVKILMAFLLNCRYKDFVNDDLCYQYPYLTKACAGEFCKEFFNKKLSFFGRTETLKSPKANCLEDVLNLHTRVDINLLENIFKYKFDNYSSEVINFSNNLSIIPFSCIFNDYYNGIGQYIRTLEDKVTGKEDILHYYVSNGLLSYEEALNIIRKINCILDEGLDMKSFNSEWRFYKPKKLSWWQEKEYESRISFRDFFKTEYLTFFDIYLKENLIVKKTDLIENFIEQIYDMLQYKIDIKEENFKLKNYNFLLNTVKMAEVYKLPQEKVDMFLDMFEVNPLLAIELVKNRKKITQKEIESFLNKMIK